MAEIGVVRREMKYTLDRCTADILRAKLGMLLPVDKFGPSEGYYVRSLYFDTLYDKDYHDKVDGLETRHKIRLRIYDPRDTTAKLEVKKKVGREQWKYSASVDREDARLIIEGAYGKLRGKYKSPFLQNVLRKMEMECYAPKTIVEFHRLAFVEYTNETRITFDTSLQATEADMSIFSTNLSLYPIAYPAILEVKYNRFLLSHIKSVLQITDQMPVSTSKYCLGRQNTFRGFL